MICICIFYTLHCFWHVIGQMDNYMNESLIKWTVSVKMLLLWSASVPNLSPMSVMASLGKSLGAVEHKSRARGIYRSSCFSTHLSCSRKCHVNPHESDKHSTHSTDRKRCWYTHLSTQKVVAPEEERGDFTHHYSL